MSLLVAVGSGDPPRFPKLRLALSVEVSLYGIFSAMSYPLDRIEWSLEIVVGSIY